ncbi:hypothetical protein [Demequina aurantiaca]|uniref:hypothetical protein n=1 Tax=Demequina aurantiaca TaxID=676200 RepID=UPI003D33FFD0
MDIPSEYIAARRTLLDTLEILEPHRDALILVGAQAVYLHAPAGLAAPAYTTDADLAISPDLLATKPEIAALLTSHGYLPTLDPGGWDSPLDVHVDLMVPDAAVVTRSRRRASLPGHDSKTARRVAGLELALIDNAEHIVSSLNSLDTRKIALKVAGPSALVLAKAVKLRERLEAADQSRIIAKDAGDLLRLLRMCDATAIGVRLDVLSRTTPHAELITSTVAWLTAEVQGRNSQVVTLTVAAAEGSERDSDVARSMRDLVRQLS